MNLTTTEIQHILTLVYANMDEGSYYGRKDYWENRSKSIVEKLEKELNERNMVLERSTPRS